MDETNAPSDCPFCSELSDLSNSEFRAVIAENLLSTRTIKATDNFVALAGLGAFREGYVLILPKMHYLSFAALEPSFAGEADILKNKLVEEIRRTFHSDVIVFEHGSISENQPAGGCIDHAHLHVMSTWVDLSGMLDDLFQRYPIRNLADLSVFQARQQPYLYYEKNNIAVAYLVNSRLPSQFIRRLIAKEVGRPAEWDWALFPGRNHVIGTVKKLRS